jgi:ribosomal protein S18 acetylase RimI-like enzyme
MGESDGLVKELNGGFRVEKAGLNKVDEVWSVIKKCSDWLFAEKKLDHWAEYYTREVIEKKIKGQEVFLVIRDGVTFGTITLDENPVEYYTEENLACFAEPKEKAIYVSAVAVDPEFQGRGVATQLMDLADEIVKQRGIKYIRFDCRAEYADLVNFYEKRGYSKRGSFSEGERQNYFLMEKEVG